MTLRRWLPLWSAVLVTCMAATVHAGTVAVFFTNEAALAPVSRSTPDSTDPVQAALSLLAAGPSAEERLQGIGTAIPEGTRLTGLVIDGPRVTVEFSEEMLSGGFGELRIESVFRQVDWTLRQFGLANDVRVTVNGKLLSAYLPPTPKITPRATRLPAGPITAGALTGHSITLSPGHGVVWNGGSWPAQRPEYCAPLNSEDFHNLELCQYLQTYLEADGMMVHAVRCMDKSYGWHPPSGRDWWQVGAYAWLQLQGYPCDVYLPLTGEADDCTIGSGEKENSDDVWSRPLASDLEGTDIYISMHTNGLTGYCVGSECPTGTLVFYDASPEHADWGAVSEALGDAVSTNVINTIVAHADSTWTCDKSGCVRNSNGDYGEIRIPDRAAILIELGYHDTCDRDADEFHLREEFFRSVAMWGVYKGVCDYFGTTPTWNIYSNEYVSDTIPSEMIGDEQYAVSITLRNRGVVWSGTRGFCLGAVGDSDPFTSFNRVGPSIEVGPGREYTFGFIMTAPHHPGEYTTEWQALREIGGVTTWFGATVSRLITVAPPPTPGDHDGDGDVDQIDFGYLQACMTGSTVEQNDPVCLWARLDDDSDVDQGDFAVFLGCMRGPDVPVSYTCAD